MRGSRHIILDAPEYNEDQIHVFAYASCIVVWVGVSPEIYRPHDGQTKQRDVDAFVNSLVANGYHILSDELLAD